MKRHEVHPARLSESRNNGRWPTRWERVRETWRDTPTFERCLCAAMIAATVGTIVFCTWSSM